MVNLAHGIEYKYCSFYLLWCNKPPQDLAALTIKVTYFALEFTVWAAFGREAWSVPLGVRWSSLAVGWRVWSKIAATHRGGQVALPSSRGWMLGAFVPLPLSLSKLCEFLPSMVAAFQGQTAFTERARKKLYILYCLTLEIKEHHVHSIVDTRSKLLRPVCSRPTFNSKGIPFGVSMEERSDTLWTNLQTTTVWSEGC